MFNFLKDKIKSAVDIVSEKIKKEEPQEEIKEEPHKEKVKEKKKELKKEQEKENLHEEIQEKGFLKKITEKVTTKTISEDKFEELFQPLELALLENNTAMEAVEKIKQDLKEDLTNNPISRKNVEQQIKNSLKKSISSLFENSSDMLEGINKQPYVICFVGVNGSGKTTTLAKVANYLQKNNKTCVLAAADTFRAASIEQLQIHADKLEIKLIKHNYGADPAAVAFDAIKYAKANKIDIVLIDTSGRLHSNENLMEELKKITRVANPDLTIFIGEAITGNDCVVQAQKFNEDVGLDALILSKQDIDEKGGTALSISYITKLPIFFIGIGQEYDDLEEFNKDKFLGQLGLDNGT
jgi:fused signal recognition particle receptor